MLVKIKCAQCQTDGTISLLEASYEGPYRCWKCRQLFKINLKNNKLENCQLLSQEEFDKLQEIEALKAKFRKS